jgi:hypothetical protein
MPKKVNSKNTMKTKKKTTAQGDGRFSKKPHSGGETFFNNTRAGSPPSPGRRHRKPSRGQGR